MSRTGKAASRRPTATHVAAPRDPAAEQVFEYPDGNAQSRPASPVSDPVGYQMEQAAAAMRADKMSIRVWGREFKDAISGKPWMFPRVYTGHNHAGEFQALVIKRWEDEPVAVVERVNAGWQVTMEGGATVIVDTAFGAASWLFKECQRREQRGELRG